LSLSATFFIRRKKEEEQRERAAKPRHKPKKEERQVAGSRRSAYQVAEKEVVLRYIQSNRFVQKRNRKIIESPSPLTLRGSQMHFTLLYELVAGKVRS
jgi:hypothetical protein